MVGTFMMRSGLNVPTPAIPIPDFAVPYAAPMPISHHQSRAESSFGPLLHPKIIANPMPACREVSTMPCCQPSGIAHHSEEGRELWTVNYVVHDDLQLGMRKAKPSKLMWLTEDEVDSRRVLKLGIIIPSQTLKSKSRDDLDSMEPFSGVGSNNLIWRTL